MSVKFGKVETSLCWSNVTFFFCIFGECRFVAEICNDITERIGRVEFDSPKFLDSQKLCREHCMLSVHLFFQDSKDLEFLHTEVTQKNSRVCTHSEPKMRP